MSACYDLAGQAARRRRVLDLLVEHTLPRFDTEGRWSSPHWSGPGLRERLWFALGYLGSGRPEAVTCASRIITGSEFRFCHFAPMTALQLLLRHEPALDPAAREALRAYLEGVLDDFLGDDLDFVGVNDNFPCMSTFTALFAGTLFDRPDLHATGRARLGQLRTLLSRRGVTTEYASPTYTPIQAYALAEIANLSPHAEIRELALACEERLWVDLLGHLHPPTAQMAGPYSRAYTVDSVGATHQARFVYYALCGDRLALDPLETIFPAPGEGQLLHGNLAFMQVSQGWLAVADYHCPPALVEAALEGPYPRAFRATTEFGSSTDAVPGAEPPDLEAADQLYQYPAGAGTISTWMEQDYALGVASHEFHNGVQTESFHLLYRRRPVQSHRDVATVYSRYVLNDRQPGQDNYYPEFDYHNGTSLLWDEGRKLGLHHRSAALLLYKPKLFARRGVTALRLSLLFPAQSGPVEELWLGGVQLDRLAGESAPPCPLFVKDGPVYLAFHPLLLTDHGRDAAVRVDTVNDFLQVSLYNYEGPARDFSPGELLLTGNGFVCEVATEGEFADFAAFRECMSRATITDRFFTCVHTRWTHLRQTRYSREGWPSPAGGNVREALTLEAEYSPATEGIKHLAVNGGVPPAPVLEAMGLDASRLPFLGG